MAKIWTAREAVVKIDFAANVALTTASPLDTFFSASTAIEGTLKDITVTEPSGEVEKIDLHGEDANGFQNAEGEEKPFSMAEVTGTLVLPGDEVSESFLYDSSAAIDGTHTRYRSGTATRGRIALLLNLDDGTDEVNYAFDNGWRTAKDAKSTGADGHFEVTWTLKCLPRDFYGPEFKD